MAEEYNFLPKINRSDLLKAKDYLRVFLPLFISDDMEYKHREIMPKLNSSQQTFLTFYLFDGSMRSGTSNLVENWSVRGGFLRTIYDGFGEYVFESPFSKIIKTWGCKKISRIVEKTKIIYKKHKGKVGEVKSLKELSVLCSEIIDFEKLDHEYMMNSIKETKIIKRYIENNLNDFAIIDENNTQDSHVDRSIKDIEIMIKLISGSKNKGRQKCKQSY
jgi:hypothetical protein